MILNRIGTALRNQDWFVVILEVLIVVFGVFIGLQVDDWNSERQDKAASIEYISALQADVSADLDMLESLMDRVLGRRQAAQEVLDILENDGKYQDPGLFLRQLDFMGRIRFPVYETATYEDMVSTGNMLVLDPEFRGLIASYYRIQIIEGVTDDLQERRVWETYLPMFVDGVSLRAQRWVFDNLHEEMAPTDHPDWIEEDAKGALQNYKQNPEVAGAIKAVIRGTWTQENIINRMLGHAQTLKAEIEAQTGIGERQ